MGAEVAAMVGRDAREVVAGEFMEVDRAGWDAEGDEEAAGGGRLA
jgi:hypothetical protein